MRKDYTCPKCLKPVFKIEGLYTDKNSQHSDYYCDECKIVWGMRTHGFAKRAELHSVTNDPYLIDKKIVKKYNPEYGDDRICVCGHPYHRHFDSYENMYPVGCKYCDCINFREAK